MSDKPQEMSDKGAIKLRMKVFRTFNRVLLQLFVGLKADNEIW